MKEIGVAEVPGREHNPRILEYHATTSLHATADEVPWCSAFLNWVFASVGIQGTASAAAASWLFWGKKLDFPTFGSVVVLARAGLTPAAYEGLRAGAEGYPPAHVGIVVRDEGEWIAVVGGNQGDRVKVSKFPKARVIGYRFPNLE